MWQQAGRVKDRVQAMPFGGEPLSKNLIAIGATALALMGCANQAKPPEPGVDYNEGIAKSCTPSTVSFASATTASATIDMTNDGWCAVRVTQADGKPFLLGLMKSRPDHGHVLVQRAGNETRVEYTADDRFVGTDSFTVALRPQGAAANAPDYTLTVKATVRMGEGMAPPPPPAAPAKKAPARSAPKKR